MPIFSSIKLRVRKYSLYSPKFQLNSSNFEFQLVMHKIDFFNPICIMKILPVRKRLSKPLASVATCASRQGNYRFRLANVFDSLFLPSRIFIIKHFFCKINFMIIFLKTRISGYLNQLFKAFTVLKSMPLNFAQFDISMIYRVIRNWIQL